MKGAILYTGGKDSHYALIEAWLRHGVKPAVLVIVRPRRSDSWMFHAINAAWATLHADAIGVPYEVVEVSGEKEVEIDELRDRLEEVIARYGCDALVTGAVASRYQKERVDKMARDLGVEHVAPLWLRDQREIFLAESDLLDFIIVAVQAYGLSESVLGVPIRYLGPHRLLQTFSKYGISPVGEGGEFETFVLASPLMKKAVCVRKARILWSEQAWSGHYVIEDAGLC